MPLAKATHKKTLEVVANPRQEKQITPRQEEFCRIYVCEDVSQTEAALRAGYSKKSAHAIASQLLNGRNFPHVVRRIAGIYIDRKEILHGRIDQMSKEEVLKEIQKLQDDFPALGAVASGNLVIEGEVTKEE